MAVESKTRSTIKALTWRFTGSGATLLISYAVTGSLGSSASIAGIQVFVSLALYYVHERLWDKLMWGRISKSKQEST